MLPKSAVDQMVGARIKKAREAMGLTVASFVAGIGEEQSRPVHYRREAGAVSVPLDVLARIAVFTGRPVGWFLQDVIAHVDGTVRLVEEASPNITITPALLTMLRRYLGLTERQQTIIGMVMRELERPPPAPGSGATT